MQSITRASRPSIGSGRDTKCGIGGPGSRCVTASNGAVTRERDLGTQLNDPMRFRLLKFIQMKNARPTTLRSGTKPQ